ncbi:MAG: response regulator transcription factor [Bacteroidia bacterium]
MKISLYIVDDHQVLIDGLRALLSNESDITIAGYSTNARIALEEIGRTAANILLTDINMPEMSGVGLVKAVHSKFPEVKILALSMHGDRQMIHDMLDAGADGYILKNTGKNELIEALKKVASGGMYFSNEISAEIMRAISEKDKKPKADEGPSLTAREIEIVKLINKEFSNLMIAEALFISERTVETHRKNIFRKTGTKGVVGLLKWAASKGLLDE